MSIRLEIDHSRQESGKEKRQEQLDRWEASETNQCPDTRDGRKSRLSFQTGAIFLSACQTSDYDEIERILSDTDNKKIINYANSDGLTALHQASIDGNIKMIKYLLEKGADINVTDNEGWNCLHASASCGYVEIARYLVDQGINIAEVTCDGELASDVCEDSPKMARYLDEIYKNVDKDIEREKEEKEMFRDSMKYYYYFQTHGVKYKPEPVDDVGASPIHVAAAKGYTIVLRVLLEAGFYIDRKDADGWTPLHAAAHWEQFDCCKILAAYGANFVTKNNLSQKPIDVVSDDLASQFRDLQKNRFTKDKLPRLPDLPPPSPTNALMLPDQPQKDPTPSPPPEIIDTPRGEPVSTLKDSRIPPATTTPQAASTATATTTDETTRRSKRTKFGVDDEQVSLEDARSKFGPATKSKTPRVKRLPSASASTTAEMDEDKRKHMSQPIPNQLTNVEQKTKAKKRRESRRSTQGVTLDILSEAKKVMEEKNKTREENKPKGCFSRVSSDVDQKTPGGYIPRSEREYESTSHTAQSMAGKNPQLEKLKAMREMAKGKSVLSSSGQSKTTPMTQSPQQSSQPKFTASEISSVTQINKKSPNSSNDASPMEEIGPKLIPEVNNVNQRNRTGSASENPNNKLEIINTETNIRKNSINNGNNDRTSGSGSSVGGYGDAAQIRPSKISNYPEHLSTFRHDKSPQPTHNQSQSVSPTQSQSTSSSSSTHSANRRHDSESSRKNHDIEQDTDYKKLYHEEKVKTESQKKQNQDLNREIIFLKQKIADLELQVRNKSEVNDDNSKLKQENAALIRIISKLSK